MRLLALNPYDVAEVLDATQATLDATLANSRYDGIRLAFCTIDSVAVGDSLPPEGALIDVDRANPVVPPTPAGGPAPVTVVAKLDFYRRCTDAEATAIEAAVAQQGARMRAIFKAAVTFRSDAEEWTALDAAATQLFGEARAAELLAAS